MAKETEEALKLLENKMVNVKDQMEQRKNIGFVLKDVQIVLTWMEAY